MSDQTSSIQKNLNSWYQKNKRDLPWRNTIDPYAIWISEIMLQQTRVDTVIDYWFRFLKKFPTVQSLAKATEEDVLTQWQGLGYYRRAKLLHKASKQIVSDYDGKLPTTQEELIKLSGFGAYTSGAVASIAFGEKVPCVDGNVIRVLSRIFATHEDVTSHAFDIAQHKDPSSINQSLMELGAMICLPKNPKCLICPLQENCKALQSNMIEQYPAPRKKTKIKNIYACALILQNKQKFLLQKRSSEGRWANMWEFPYFEFETRESRLKSFLQNQFPNAKNIQSKGKVTHQLTHQNIEVEVFSATTDTKATPTKSKAWKKDFSDIPTSVLAKKIAAL